MKRPLICLALLTPMLSVLAGISFPRDVQKFIDRREGCDHMRGEIPDPGERQRMREVNHEIEKLCRGTDKQLAQLKKKYASNAMVMLVWSLPDTAANLEHFGRPSNDHGGGAWPQLRAVCLTAP